jgi:hypothetical protein
MVRPTGCISLSSHRYQSADSVRVPSVADRKDGSYIESAFTAASTFNGQDVRGWPHSPRRSQPVPGDPAPLLDLRPGRPSLWYRAHHHGLIPAPPRLARLTDRCDLDHSNSRHPGVIVSPQTHDYPARTRALDPGFLPSTWYSSRLRSQNLGRRGCVRYHGSTCVAGGEVDHHQALRRRLRPSWDRLIPLSRGSFFLAQLGEPSFERYAQTPLHSVLHVGFHDGTTMAFVEGTEIAASLKQICPPR